MKEQLINIEKALADSSSESIAEFLDRIRHELKLANALKIVEIKVAHNIGNTAMNSYIEDAIAIVDMH